MAIGMAAIQVGLAATAAAQKKVAADKEASAQKEQAVIVAQETEREAKRQEEANKEFQARQRLQFLKSGVRLEGTPLQVLAQTEASGAEEVEAFRASGGARSRLLGQKAKIIKGKGNAALAEGVGKIATSKSTGTLYNAAKSKWFSDKPASGTASGSASGTTK